MNSRHHWLIGLVLIVLVMMALWTSSLVVGAPNRQVNTTEQQQTIDAIVQQRFQQTAMAQQQLGATQTIDAAFNQALTGTQVFQNTLNAAFSAALTATSAPTLTQLAAIERSSLQTSVAVLTQTAASYDNLTATAVASGERFATEQKAMTNTAIAPLRIEFQQKACPISENTDFDWVDGNSTTMYGSSTTLRFNNAATGGMYPITDPTPLRSPNNKYVAFFLYDNFYIAEATASLETQYPYYTLLIGSLFEFTSIPNAQPVSWSPDSSKYIYSVSDHDLFLVDVASQTNQNITAGYDADPITQVVWSPDSHSVAYETQQGVWLSTLTGQAAFLSEGAIYGWSPFGHQIAVLTPDGIRIFSIDSAHTNIFVPSAQHVFWSLDENYLKVVLADGDYLLKSDFSSLDCSNLASIETIEATQKAAAANDQLPTPTSTAMNTLQPITGDEFSAIVQSLSVQQIAVIGVSELPTTFGNTLIVTVCSTAGSIMRTTLPQVMNTLGKQSLSLDNGIQAVGTRMVDCESSDTLLLMVAVDIASAKSYAAGELTDVVFANKWLPQ